MFTIDIIVIWNWRKKMSQGNISIKLKRNDWKKINSSKFVHRKERKLFVKCEAEKKIITFDKSCLINWITGKYHNWTQSNWKQIDFNVISCVCVCDKWFSCDSNWVKWKQTETNASNKIIFFSYRCADSEISLKLGILRRRTKKITFLISKEKKKHKYT